MRANGDSLARRGPTVRNPRARLERDREALRLRWPEEGRAALDRIARASYEELGLWCESGELHAVVQRLVREVYAHRADEPERMEPLLDLPFAYQVADRIRKELLYVWASPERVRESSLALSALQAACDEVLTSEGLPPVSGTDALALVLELAHDMRSPLTAILALTDTLQLDAESRGHTFQKQQLGTIYSAALGMSSLAANITELIQGGHRLTDALPEPFAVSEVMDAVRAVVHLMAERKGIKLRFVPPPGAKRVGHPSALRRVLLNLVTNAVKYTDEGFVEVVAEVLEGDRVRFVVRDSGRGLPEEIQGNLNSSVFRKGDGNLSTGIGIALCARLLRAMDSRLEADSIAGWGTRIFFELDLPPG